MTTEATAREPGTELTRLRLDIAYDGTEFTGWSRQPSLRTVQGELEASLATVFSRHGDAPTLTVAGRTDAGVHALGQVAHLDLTSEQLASLERPHRGPSGRAKLDPVTALARRLNGIAGLSSDVYVSRVSRAPAGFDARFSAVWRRYEYRVSDEGGPRNPLERNRTLWIPRALDVESMNTVAGRFLGLHDWAAFCKPKDFGTSIRTLQDFSWHRAVDGVVVARLQADAFCHSMVRALVGASLAVGAGQMTPERMIEIREQLERTSEFKVVPAKGLTLMEVGYPADHELAARAEQTRAIRPPLDAPEASPVG
ncbi:tRNA pseudouridine(38-40) synthase TruA [Marisediminicola sp. LYQ134]|uniref:tRNA pseudouridine(38-40) synthase TruA n=1 Tax=unclassified Marisediminicola TaxID=2618316 RepID=UPI003982ED5A